MAASRKDCPEYRDNDVVIVSAVRTPVGSLNGDLSSLKAHELGAVVIREVLSRCSLAGCDVDEVVLGQVLTAGKDRNVILVLILLKEKKIFSLALILCQLLLTNQQLIYSVQI